MVADRDAVELEVDQGAHRAAGAQLAVAQVQRRPASRGATADRQVEVGAADVRPVEVGPVDAQDVGVRDARGVAVDVEGVGLAVEHLDAGGVAPGLVHRQAAGELDVVGHLGVHAEAQAAGVHQRVVGVVAVHRGRGQEHGDQLLLHLGREHGHRLLRASKVRLSVKYRYWE